MYPYAGPIVPVVPAGSGGCSGGDGMGLVIVLVIVILLGVAIGTGIVITDASRWTFIIRCVVRVKDVVFNPGVALTFKTKHHDHIVTGELYRWETEVLSDFITVYHDAFQNPVDGKPFVPPSGPFNCDIVLSFLRTDGTFYDKKRMVVSLLASNEVIGATTPPLERPIVLGNKLTHEGKEHGYLGIVRGGSARNAKKRRARVAAPQQWRSTGRKVRTPDGAMRTAYKHATTGEVRVKRMVVRAGKRCAQYYTFRSS